MCCVLKKVEVIVLIRTCSQYNYKKREEIAGINKKYSRVIELSLVVVETHQVNFWFWASISELIKFVETSGREELFI